MEYLNPQPPEGINTSPDHSPVRDLLWLSAGALVLVLTLAAVLVLAGGWLARQVPFAMEKQLAARFADDAPIRSPQLKAYLEGLKNRLLAHSDLPAGMDITLHYVDDDTVNAFATLGGHMVLFRGLLERVPDENTLAMVLAHEIAHVKHRDPLVALSRGLLISTALASLVGKTPAPLDKAALLTILSYGRGMELAADAAAAQALAGTYGHLGGSQSLFRLFQQLQGHRRADWQAFLQTHPLNRQRIEQLQALSAANNWPLTGPLTPLPAGFHDWLKADDK